MISQVKIINKETLSNYKYSLEKVTYEYVTDKGKPETQKREIYNRGNAAAILLYNKEQKTIILTRQFRLSTLLNGNASGMLIEVCAGLLDNDSPEECAKREAEEETGYRLPEVKKIFEAYMSPGSLTELVHFFIAEYNSDMKVSKGGGLEEEQEYIDVLEIPVQEAVKMVGNGEIKDAKTIMLLQYAQLNKLV